MKDRSLAGETTGIGLTISGKLAEDKYVEINAERIPPDEFLHEHIRHMPGETRAVDIEKPGLEIGKYKDLKILVMNAGRGIHEKIREGHPDKWRNILNLHICRTLRVLRADLPFMDNGNVIFLSSVSASNTHPSGGNYATTKGALATQAETLRHEEQPEIKLTDISPGIVNTPFFKDILSSKNRTGADPRESIEPEEIAGAVLIAVNRRSGTTINNMIIRSLKGVL
ncbi:MAG: SDR family NAD(P)-dependent oxidoreductase [Cyclobacteriaceae bacterium]|nr:SDR family NAD(P)-dependent oxidoreductase [Cyclobacteriaceae bacterium]